MSRKLVAVIFLAVAIVGGGAFLLSRPKADDSADWILLGCLDVAQRPTGAVKVRPDGSLYWVGGGQRCMPSLQPGYPSLILVEHAETPDAGVAPKKVAKK